jgi:hypothetical protein
VVSNCEYPMADRHSGSQMPPGRSRAATAVVGKLRKPYYEYRHSGARHGANRS